MAWNEVKETMSFREEILSLGRQPDTNIRELCRRFKVSPKTFYKWLKRTNVEGVVDLSNRSRRPHQSPARTDPAVESNILAERAEHPSSGCPQDPASIVEPWPGGSSGKQHSSQNSSEKRKNRSGRVVETSTLATLRA